MVPVIEQLLGFHISASTLTRTARRLHIVTNPPRAIPYLTEEHKLERLWWCYQHLHDDKNNWLFADEKSFQSQPNRVRQHHLRGQQPELPMRRRAGGSVCAWMGISRMVPPLYHTMTTTMDSDSYVDTITQYLPFNNLLLVHDNAPPHRSRTTVAAFARHQIPTLQLPRYSPDLNPLENLWNEINRRVQSVRLYNLHYGVVESLSDTVGRVLDGIDQDVVNRYLVNYNNRLLECIRRGGDYTGY